MTIDSQGLYLTDVGLISSKASLNAYYWDCLDPTVCYFTVSNLQFFGYTYFVPEIVTPTSTEIFVPTGMEMIDYVGTTIQYTYLIGDDSTIVNDEFAFSGIFV
jgi:hypothetical protein